MHLLKHVKQMAVTKSNSCASSHILHKPYAALVRCRSISRSVLHPCVRPPWYVKARGGFWDTVDSDEVGVARHVLLSRCNAKSGTPRSDYMQTDWQGWYKGARWYSAQGTFYLRLGTSQMVKWFHPSAPGSWLVLFAYCLLCTSFK